QPRSTIFPYTTLFRSIGREVACVAAEQGAQLVLVDRAEQVAQLAQRLSAQTPAHHVIADLETWEGAETAARFAVEQYGKIDVCIDRKSTRLNSSHVSI